MLLSSRGMFFDVAQVIIDNYGQRFAGYYLAGADQSFLGLDFSVEVHSLKFFMKDPRALKDVVCLSIGCTVADLPSSSIFYESYRSHCGTSLK